MDRLTFRIRWTVHNVPLSLTSLVDDLDHVAMVRIPALQRAWSLRSAVVRTQHLVRRALKLTFKNTGMSPLVDYVLFNKNIPELPDSSREELEAVYREVQPIRSKEVAERLSPSTVSSVPSLMLWHNCVHRVLITIVIRNQTNWFHMNNNRPQFVASLCPLLSRGSLLFFPGGLSSSPVLLVVSEPDEMVSDEQQSSPVCCFNLSISLTRFATVFPGGLSSSQFYPTKLSVIVLVLRCDHRVVVTLGRGLAPQRLKMAWYRAIYIRRRAFNWCRAAQIKRSTFEWCRAAQIKRSTFARYNVIGYIPLHYLHTNC
jgi:hypothetical protein